MSGNTCGARYWTDGKMVAPMLPDSPWLVKCPHCAALIWIDELEEVGAIQPWEPLDATGFKDARPPEKPSLKNYRAVLSAPVSNVQKERYLRFRAWWAGNDRRRKTGKAAPMTGPETANLRAFLPFLDDTNENDRVLKAEALRELGMFTEAAALLSGPFNDNAAQAVAIIKDLVERQVTTVMEMKLE